MGATDLTTRARVACPRCDGTKSRDARMCRRCYESQSAEKFWGFVDKTGECWTWTRARATEGYGLTLYGKETRAHRVAYLLEVGDIPPGMFVCHRCDNPPCVNPSHLFLGTPADNFADMLAKGRAVRSGPRGEDNSSAKLTEKDVREIRDRVDAGGSRPALALQYGVSSRQIARIARRERWRHVA